MSEKAREKSSKDEAEEVKEILSVVSTEIPTLIKNIIASVFSEEAGRNMGKAAGAFYKELKESGMPADAALRMTEDYMETFTGFGDLLKSVGKGNTNKFFIHHPKRPESPRQEDKEDEE
ncbi:MAG: hypothetical protein JSV51_06745 [Candidatus Bathyarchaeota archaeon]|nr:MAG: hypothetical protein JSV51_06745 [Candidatus Bathyarchaeota archaeon]